MSLSYRTAMLALLMAASLSASAQEAAAPAATETTAAAAAAPAAAANTLIAPAPADKGQIVFFRPSKMVGAALGFKVRENETELGKLRNGKYFVIQVEPGAHAYNMHGETKDVLNMEIEAGETYYVSASVGMGIIAGRPNLSPSDEAAFLAASKKLKKAE
jgi:hypothetical protein